MKPWKLFVTVVAIVAAFSIAQAQVDTLTILHLADTHSHLLPYGPKDSNGNPTLGGMARLATVVGMTRATEPNVMLFHSGDLFVGDFMFQKYVGVEELGIMQALQYDALELATMSSIFIRRPWSMYSIRPASRTRDFLSCAPISI